MGNAIGCCTNPEENGEISPGSMIERMHSFDKDLPEKHDQKNKKLSDTPGNQLLRDFYQHVVDTDQSDSGEEDLFHESKISITKKIQLNRQRSKSLIKNPKDTFRQLNVVDPLTMYGSMGILQTNESSLLQDDRLLRSASVDTLFHSKLISNEENGKYKPFWAEPKKFYPTSIS